MTILRTHVALCAALCFGVIACGADSLPPHDAGPPPLPESPFAIHEVPGYVPELADLDIHWVRLAGGFGLVWDRDEPEEGRYDWSVLDEVIGSFDGTPVNILLTIASFNAWDRGVSATDGLFKYGLPKDMEAFQRYLQTAVKRYPQVLFYQIENEPTNSWNDSEENLAKLTKAAYLTIKANNPRAQVALAGAGSPKAFHAFYPALLANLEELREPNHSNYFDLADLHWSGQFEFQDKKQGSYKTETFPERVYDLKTEIGLMRQAFAAIGSPNTPIWITEMTDYSGEPLETNYLPQSEEEQAIELLKRFVYSISIGIDRIFWSTIEDGHGFCGEPGNYFDHVGLIHNPQNEGGLSHKKLSYYTYKKLVEVLDGADWSKTETLEESDGLYVIEFSRQTKPIWVAWNDSETSKTVTISNIEAARVRITETIPDAASGQGVTDYPSAFKTSTKEVAGGSVTISLQQRPLFIEED